VKRPPKNNVSLIIADVLIFFLCCGGYYFTLLKPDLSFNASVKNSAIVVSENRNHIKNIKVGDEIVTFEGLHFTNWEQLEIYLDGKSIGDSVQLQLSRDAEIISTSVCLTSYYSFFDLLVIAIVALVFIGMGVFVRIKAEGNYSALLFHWASLGLAMVIVMTPGHYNNLHFSYSHINRIVWLFAYSLTPVLFIHFTFSFSQKKVRSIKYILTCFYLSSLIITAVLAYLFIDAAVFKSIVSQANYVFFFDSFFRIFLIACIIAAISICIFAYRQATDREERKRLQWLLLGFFIGPLSFVVFWVIPIILIGSSLVPESLVLIFLTAIPITFSIAIIKYHLMDINLLIRRSVLYALVLGVVILTYIGVSSLITLLVSDYNPAIPSVFIAFVVVILLQPTKNKIQKIIDKKFFRVEYDFREEQNNFLDAMKEVYNIHSLANLIVERVDKLIPVEKIGFFELNNHNNRIKIIAENGWDVLRGRSIRFEFENLNTDLSLPIAVDNKIEPGLNIESADIEVFKRWGMVLVFPVKSPSGTIHGFLVLGVKKSGIRFLKDDIDLLNPVVFAAALAIDRIKLQEELILEHLESERLEELNKLKSFFMQTITHELKTPLTSIKMFTEKLYNMEKLSKDKSNFYLNVIDGESTKLRRLIDNILDYARIEKGMKTYSLRCIDLVRIIKNSINSVEYLFNMKKQEIQINMTSEEILINGDEDAVERAITNLLTNASKYSHNDGKTIVSLGRENCSAFVEIKDEGRGIPDRELNEIFEPFKRVKDVDNKKIEGTGLGLAIVKHIMDAHQGRIEVESEVGKGSKFTLYFNLANE